MRLENDIEYEVWTVLDERYMKSMKYEIYALCVCGSMSLYGSLCYHSLSVVSHHNSTRVYVQVA